MDVAERAGFKLLTTMDAIYQQLGRAETRAKTLIKEDQKDRRALNPEHSARAYRMPGEVLKELNTEISDLGGFSLPRIFVHLDEMATIFEAGATRDGRKGWMDDMIRTMKLKTKIQNSAKTGMTRERVLVMLMEFFPPESHNREQLEEDLDYYRIKVTINFPAFHILQL